MQRDDGYCSCHKAIRDLEAVRQSSVLTNTKRSTKETKSQLARSVVDIIAGRNTLQRTLSRLVNSGMTTASATYRFKRTHEIIKYCNCNASSAAYSYVSSSTFEARSCCYRRAETCQMSFMSWHAQCSLNPGKFSVSISHGLGTRRGRLETS